MKVIVFRWVTSRESARSSSLHRDGLAVEHCGWLNLHISRISRAEHSVGKAVAGRKTAHVTLVNLETDAHVDCCWSRRIVFQALRRCSGARLRASLTSNLRFARGSEEEAAVQVRPPPAPVTSRHRAWALSGDRSGTLALYLCHFGLVLHNLYCHGFRGVRFAPKHSAFASTCPTHDLLIAARPGSGRLLEEGSQ